MVSKVRNVRLGVFSGGGCHHPNTVVSFLDYKSGQYKGRYGVLDMVFKIRDHHHRIHHQILRPIDGLILILAQS